jgi:hypothetical protein
VIYVALVTMVLTLASILLFRIFKVHERDSIDFASMKKYGAEFIGTFALVFAGTGAIVINDVSGGVVTHVGVALTFGLIVLAMIYAVGDVSGAHLNPAVTLGFSLRVGCTARSFYRIWQASWSEHSPRVRSCAFYFLSIRHSEQPLLSVRLFNL